MSGRKASSKTSAGQHATSRPAIRGIPAPPPTANRPILENPLLQQRYQELIRHHLDRLLDRLFTEVTGLHFHIAWAPTAGKAWKDRTLPTACSAGCRLSGSPLRPACRLCGPKQLARALAADKDGHQFTCELGVRSYWLPIRVREETLGLAYLQALEHSTKKRLDDAATIAVNPAAFARAARLLHFVIRYVQTASLSDLRKTELLNAGRTVVAMEKEQARLHEALKRHLPVAANTPRSGGAESHPEQLVHSLLECIASNYSQPITLSHCAASLQRNVAYLSDLFSHAVGVPFKTHLTELRMAKAREMLGTQEMNVSEVAAAVGYNSENRFRLAFKKATGLSPKEWRETMQTDSPLADGS